jgi:hypothetical protein
MVTFPVLLYRLAVNKAAVATAAGGGTTQAEVEALARFLLLCSQRPADTIQIMKLDPAGTAALSPQ